MIDQIDTALKNKKIPSKVRQKVNYAKRKETGLTSYHNTNSKSKSFKTATVTPKQIRMPILYVRKKTTCSTVSSNRLTIYRSAPITSSFFIIQHTKLPEIPKHSSHTWKVFNKLIKNYLKN